MPVKPPHLHPFYGSENMQQIVLRLYGGGETEIQSPTTYTVGLAGSEMHSKAT